MYYLDSTLSQLFTHNLSNNLGKDDEYRSVVASPNTFS